MYTIPLFLIFKSGILVTNTTNSTTRYSYGGFQRNVPDVLFSGIFLSHSNISRMLLFLSTFRQESGGAGKTNPAIQITLLYSDCLIVVI